MRTFASAVWKHLVVDIFKQTLHLILTKLYPLDFVLICEPFFKHTESINKYLFIHMQLHMCNTDNMSSYKN